MSELLPRGGAPSATGEAPTATGPRQPRPVAGGPAGERLAAGAPGAMLVIISGPSGVGKDTIIAAMRSRPHDPDYHYIVTCTTRGRRRGEVDGLSYHFLSEPAFAALRDAGELLEANEVHGNWYGTPRDEVRRALADGRHVILKIDVQGAQVVKERVPEALLIFVVPPSLESLFHRLQSRATETADELELRQRNAALELARQDDYDYVVVNEDGQVDRTAVRIDEIIAAEAARHPDRRVRV
ncbi:MAG TPA: guanylate kinase [Candidatus Limnocylindrales bacterium]